MRPGQRDAATIACCCGHSPAVHDPVTGQCHAAWCECTDYTLTPHRS